VHFVQPPFVDVALVLPAGPPVHPPSVIVDPVASPPLNVEQTIFGAADAA
jgi:hypothetical protein